MNDVLWSDGEFGQGEPAPEGRGRAFDGAFSAESFLASVALHLAVLLLVIVCAVERPDSHHESLVVDIGSLTLPESHGLESTQSTAASAAGAASEPPAVAGGGAVEVPSEAAAEAVAAEQTEAQPPEASLAEPSTPAAEAAAPDPSVPSFPEPTLPHQHGEYDPFEVYKAAVAQRVSDLTASSKDLPARTLFSGKLAVHLYLNPLGSHLQSPKICMGHSQVFLAASLPMPVAQQHFMVLVREVVGALLQGTPYPEAPAGVEIPREMTYFIELGPGRPIEPQG